MKKSSFLLLVAFISGLAVMAMEISASRLLAPYFGTSLFIWTNIIGVVMVALALGYYWGGRLADRAPQLPVLLKIIFGAGVLFLLIPWLIRPLSSSLNLTFASISAASLVIFISSLLTTAILFSVPLVLLGMTSPFIIKLYSAHHEGEIGEMAGRVFAVSTIGSILGTFLPTLYFIPALGTRATINIFAALLLAIGLFGWPRSKRVIIGIAALLAVIFCFWFKGPIRAAADTIHEDESAYQYINVQEDAAGTRYLVFNEGLGIQSVYNPLQPLTGYYYDYFNVLPRLLDNKAGAATSTLAGLAAISQAGTAAGNQAPAKKKVLILGLCGGTIARQLAYYYPGQLEITGVEIDSKVIAVAKQYFGLNDVPVKVVNSDGRMFLQNSQEKYDLIIVDAYQEELYIPWTMTTAEFWQAVKDHLAPGGLAAFNANSPTADSKLLTSLTNTVAEVFPHAYLTPLESWNFLVAASPVALDWNSLPERNGNPDLANLGDRLAGQTQKISYDAGKPLLTDDRAPVEFLTDQMAFNYLKESMK